MPTFMKSNFFKNTVSPSQNSIAATIESISSMSTNSLSIRTPIKLSPIKNPLSSPDLPSFKSQKLQVLNIPKPSKHPKTLKTSQNPQNIPKPSKHPKTLKTSQNPQNIPKPSKHPKNHFKSIKKEIICSLTGIAVGASYNYACSSDILSNNTDNDKWSCCHSGNSPSRFELVLRLGLGSRPKTPASVSLDSNTLAWFGRSFGGNRTRAVLSISDLPDTFRRNTSFSAPPPPTRPVEFGHRSSFSIELVDQEWFLRYRHTIECC